MIPKLLYWDTEFFGFKVGLISLNELFEDEIEKFISKYGCKVNQ
jgi:hypothetical protein